MVLNSIYLYSYSGHTLAMRDYNPEEPTIDASKSFVKNHLQKCLAKNSKLRNSIGAKPTHTEKMANLSPDLAMDGLPIIAVQETEFYAVYVVRKDVVYTAFAKASGDLSTILDYLGVLVQTFEGVWGEEIVTEVPKRSEVHFILDLLMDYGIPMLPDKNILSTFIKKKGTWSKVMDKAMEEIRTNEDAFWHPHLSGIVSMSEECLIDHDEIVTGQIDFQ